MKTNISILLCSILIMLSCDDGLIRFPIDKPSDGTFLSSETEMNLAIHGAYATFRVNAETYTLPIFLVTEVLTDVAWERSDLGWMSLGNGQFDSNNYQVSSWWSKFYSGVGRANFIIANIHRGKDNVSSAFYNRILAEAKFVRAMHYFWLTETYGDLPFTTAPISDLNSTQMAKTAKAEIVAVMMKDLSDAAEHLPTSIPATELGRASKGAALTLRAKYALHNGLWSEAAISAQQVMGLGYKLADNYEDLFLHGKQQATPEVILSLQFLYQYYIYEPPGFRTRMGSGYSAKIPTQSLVDSYECTDGLSIDKSPLFDVQKPFDNRDPRLGFTCVVPGGVFAGYQFETHKDSLLCWNYNVTPATRVNNNDAINAYASFSGYCWRKYANSTRNDPTVGECPMIIFRYADVLLMYAEAKIEANQIDDSVYEAINAVRGRKGVDMPPIQKGKSQQELRAAVRRERKYELALEGHRLFDIRRWKLAENVMSGELLGRIPRGVLSTAPAVDEYATPSYSNVPNKMDMRVIELRSFNKQAHYLSPIPRLEIETNKLLTQNPGY